MLDKRGNYLLLIITSLIFTKLCLLKGDSVKKEFIVKFNLTNELFKPQTNVKRSPESLEAISILIKNMTDKRLAPSDISNQITVLICFLVYMLNIKIILLSDDKRQKKPTRLTNMLEEEELPKIDMIYSSMISMGRMETIKIPKVISFSFFSLKDFRRPYINNKVFELE